MNRVSQSLFAGLLSISSVLLPTAAVQADPASCHNVTLGLVEWTDLEVTSTVAEVLLEKLGYKVNTVTDSVDGIYQQMASKNADAFLGNWIPTSSESIAPYLGRRELEVLETNLNGAMYTLAVPQYVYDQGVTSVADLARYADRFGDRIYGLEAGNDGNKEVQSMIDKNAFGLGKFKLIETSERLMLAQVKGKTRKGDWIAFLAWTPHPMNQNFDIAYLDGADDYFGPNKGAAQVRTIVRGGLKEECPNVARLLTNLTFSLEMEEKVMDQVMNGFVPTKRAVHMWMNQNEAQLAHWLKGVKTLDGQSPDSMAIASSLKVGLGRDPD
ncbi:glycine betaine ABC transporter substrate-binding protein [Oceanobacter mangrovi]|uniref:glycine betaine ABC transporter substrate-binding protein n=1 Tax=Oceanobacter mangrovi TaxID=2862510 RepID=UPI001C8EE13D|nr:glycine betaine ABC transporter substrate-binding protein [Oceanobacter mangrovi]